MDGWTMDGTLGVVVGIAVLGWVIWNQMRVREFSPRRLRVAWVLGIVGLVEVVQAAPAAGAEPVSALGWTLLVTGLGVGAVLGVARAATTHLWVADGRVRTQGRAATAALWVVGIGAHLGLDLLAKAVAPSADDVNTAGILLFIAVTLGAQGLVTMRRARALAGTPVLAGVLR